MAQDAEADQLLDIAALADAEGIRQGLEDLRRGRVQPEMIEKFTALLEEARAQGTPVEVVCEP